MSDISVLSNQYEWLAKTSDRINNSVIAIKKYHLLSDNIAKRQHPQITVSGDEMEVANAHLSTFLQNLQKILKDDAQESEDIPSLILEDYKKELARNQYLSEDIDEILQLLTDGQPLEQRHISTLDEILSVVDIERKALFRKLRTARG